MAIEQEDFEFHRQKVEVLLNTLNVVNLRKICEAQVLHICAFLE